MSRGLCCDPKYGYANSSEKVQVRLELNGTKERATYGTQGERIVGICSRKMASRTGYPPQSLHMSHVFPYVLPSMY